MTNATSASPRGHIFVIAAPSGTGKTTLCRHLLVRDPRLRLSVSHTTRAIRSGEEDGVHYHFVSEKAFRDLDERSAFLEHAAYGDNRYGTSWAAIEAPLEAGEDVVLEIEVQGAEPTAGGGRRWNLKVTIRNLDSRRRWFVLPGRLGAERPVKFQATGRETLRFTEHVRAYMTHFTGPHELYVLPLASGSDAVLSGWTVEGTNGDSQFDVIALNRLRVAGEVVQFDKKVSYELRIANAGATRIASRSDTPVEVELQSKQTLSASLGDAVQTH